MKIACWCFIWIGIMIFCGCTQTVHIDSEKTSPQVTIDPKTTEVVTEQGPVRILFDIRGEFPDGALRPDVVYMDGKVLLENITISKGNHTFSIEKKGYQKKSFERVVEDPDQDGLYHLVDRLETKERVVMFDIRDKLTSKVLTPDQVVLVNLEEGDQVKKSISDRAYIKPARKKLVIQKQGYVPIYKDITIDPDEEPFILRYEMVPENK